MAPATEGANGIKIAITASFHPPIRLLGDAGQTGIRHHEILIIVIVVFFLISIYFYD